KNSVQLQFISVTDTESPDEHLQTTTFQEAERPNNDKIDAFEVRYSFTSSQSVKKLFEYLGVDAADAVFASHFMNYLTPQVFEGVTSDVIDSLAPGGHFQVHQYATFTGANLSRDDEHIPHNEHVLLAKKSASEGQEVSTGTILARSQELLSDPAATKEAMTTAVRE